MSRILCLWLPNWAIQRAIRARPELKKTPVALVASGDASTFVKGRGNQSGQSIVAVCCGRAAKQGVRPGMPLAEAEALARGLTAAPYEPAADRRALVKLAEVCERFSPSVAIEEGDEPESLLFDISNLEHLYGSEAKLASQLEKFFTQRGYRVRLALAGTIGAAWAAAHFEKNPIEGLRISDNTSTLLHELGIETVGQLLALPREELTSRFGGELLQRLDQLTGRGRELIEPRRGLPALVAAHALEEPTGDCSVLLHVLRQLVDQLSQQLAARDQGVVLLTCLLHLAGGTPGVCDGRGEEALTTPFAESQGVPPSLTVPLRIGLLQPSASAQQLLELIELHLETVRLANEVDRVELRATVVGRLGERQRDLFTDRWPTDPHQLALLVNRLSSRLGCERVLRAGLRKSPIPERAVEWRAVTGTEQKKNRSMPARKPARLQAESTPPRPLLLYSEPRASKVTGVEPNGPPQFLWMNHHRERIVSYVGPERIETLWWRGPSVRRDYYRVVTESGGHLWIFRQLVDQRWFVHGEFA